MSDDVESSPSYSPVSTTENERILWDEFEQYYKTTDFTWREKLLLIVSLCTYFADVFSDGYLAYNYYKTGNIWYFGLTLTFVLFPAVILSIFNHVEYINYANFVHKHQFPFISKWGIIFRKFCMISLISPVPRYIEAWISGERFKKAKTKGEKEKMYMHFLFMYVEKRTATLNGLIEGFLESAPQLTLQLYIVAAGTIQSEYDFWRGASQAVSIITSVISLALALTKFRQLLQSVDANICGDEPTWLAYGVLFLAHLTEIAARAFAISLFTTVFGWIVVMVILIHNAAVLITLYLIKYEVSYRQLEHENNVKKFSPIELFFLLLLSSAVSTFSYMPNSSKDFRPRHYQLFCFVQNVQMIAFWWAYSSETDARHWYHYCFSIGHFVLFAIAVGLFALFYEYPHHINELKNTLTNAWAAGSSRLRRIFCNDARDCTNSVPSGVS